MSLRPEPTQRAVVAYLKALGLDPEKILDVGWDGTGYHELDRQAEYVRDSTGVHPASTWREWPENFDYGYFMSLTWRMN